MKYAKSLSKEEVFARAKAKTLIAKALIPNRKSPEGKLLQSLNPFDNSIIGHVESCNSDTVNEAVAIARETFEDGTWSSLSPSDRKAAMQRWVSLLKEHKDELAALDCVDVGNPSRSVCLRTFPIPLKQLPGMPKQ